LRLGFNKSDILCIDWDERSLRVLEATLRRGKPTVRRAVNAPIPAGLDVRDPSVMGDFLRRTLGEHRIRTRRAISNVPRQEAVLNRLSLPTGTMDELAAMVHLQIAKELPFSKDQAIIDFAVVPKEGPTCDVWVAAIRVNVLEYYRQVFANSGIKLERVGLRPHANLLAARALGLTEGRVVLVDIGPAMTEINILRDGVLMYTRAAPVPMPVSPAAGSATDGDGEAAEPEPVEPSEWPVDTLLIEVSRTIAAYRATDLGAAIDRIILSGAADIGEQLVGAFEERFGVQTQLYSLPEEFRGRAELNGATAPFSAAVGLALGSLAEAGERFDFLHVKEPEAEHRERIKRRPYFVAAIAMLAVAAGVFAYQPIRARKVTISGLQAAIRSLNHDEKQRTAALKKIADLYDYQDKNVVWIDYLQKLAAVFPSNKDCYITQLEANTEKGLITLKLAAANRFVAARAVESISAVVDEKGKPIFKAVAGNKADYSKDAEYPVSDEVTVTVLPIAPKPKTQR